MIVKVKKIRVVDNQTDIILKLISLCKFMNLSPKSIGRYRALLCYMLVDVRAKVRWRACYVFGSRGRFVVHDYYIDASSLRITSS